MSQSISQSELLGMLKEEFERDGMVDLAERTRSEIAKAFILDNAMWGSATENVGRSEVDLGGTIAPQLAAEHALDNDISAGSFGAAGRHLTSTSLARDHKVPAHNAAPIVGGVVHAHRQSVGESKAKMSTGCKSLILRQKGAL
jgi:hypothetical protein